MWVFNVSWSCFFCSVVELKLKACACYVSCPTSLTIDNPILEIGQILLKVGNYFTAQNYSLMFDDDCWKHCSQDFVCLSFLLLALKNFGRAGFITRSWERSWERPSLGSMASISPATWGYRAHGKRSELYVYPTYVEMSSMRNNNAV